LEWSPVYHVKGWGKFNRHYGDFCTGADTILDSFELFDSHEWESGGATPKIDRGNCQCFVHRHHKITGAHDATLVSQSAGKRLAQSDAYVFHGVMLVNVEVAIGLELEIESSVTREKLQHVVEKTNAG